MKYISLFVLFILLSSCKTNQEETADVYQQPKTVLLKSYFVPELTQEAKDEIKDWKSFLSFYRIMINLAPNHIVNDNKLLNTSLDSLVIYKRLYPRGTKVLRENIYVDKDWHAPKTPTDTIYRLTSDNKDMPSYLQWNQKLAKDIEYVFSAYFQGDNSREIILKINKVDEEIYRPVIEKSFSLDSIFKAEKTNISQISDTGDGWRHTELFFTPDADGLYSLQIALPESQDSSVKNLLYYASDLKIRSKDLAIINEISSGLIDDNINIKSSYNSVFFWLDQMEDELNLLLSQDQFPEKINTPIIKSRFHLLTTRIKELKDIVKNNPNLEDKEISQKIYTLEKGFGHIVESINSVYNDKLNILMEQAKEDLERLKEIYIPVPIDSIPEKNKNN